MLKRADVATYRVLQDLAGGRWQGGVRAFGLREKGVDYVYDGRNGPLIPRVARDGAERLRREIIAGKVRAPTERAGE
jgi:basic membrane lipoprotein Med (substrate-binding protein (PBP1-ABC) superfamily)